MNCALCGSEMEIEYKHDRGSYNTTSFVCPKNQVLYLNGYAREYCKVISVGNGNENITEYFYSTESEICIVNDQTEIYLYGKHFKTYKYRFSINEINQYLQRLSQKVAAFV